MQIEKTQSRAPDEFPHVTAVCVFLFPVRLQCLPKLPDTHPVELIRGEVQQGISPAADITNRGSLNLYCSFFFFAFPGVALTAVCFA